MSAASVRVVSAITRRLLLHSALIGVLVGLVAGLGMFGIHIADVTLRGEEYGSSEVEPGWLLIFVPAGLVVGPVMGLAGGVGAVLLLRLRAALRPPPATHYPWTAGVGAGIVTAAGAGLVLNAIWVSSFTLVVVAIGCGAVSATIAFFETRRVLNRM